MTALPVRASVADRTTLCREVLAGLLSEPKMLPPKLFYDERGAELFEKICDLPEYYLTRSECAILRSHAGDIAALAGADCAVIEYGSGAGIKIRILLDALKNTRAYVPVDISRRQLEEVSREIAREYPGVTTIPVCADYTSRFRLPDLPRPAARKIAFFPGSTIGNFHPAEAAAFLSRVRQTVAPGGALILGVDRAKSKAVLVAAYNDTAGVTAEFNLNILERVNRDFGANFDVRAFRHVAFFNEGASRIEMHLESRRSQVVHIGETDISFGRGETIWTESSYKYSEEALGNLASAAGFSIDRLWTDDAGRFWVAWMTT